MQKLVRDSCEACDTDAKRYSTCETDTGSISRSGVKCSPRTKRLFFIYLIFCSRHVWVWTDRLGRISVKSEDAMMHVGDDKWCVVLVVAVYCDDGMMIFFVRLRDWTRERNNGDV